MVNRDDVIAYLLHQMPEGDRAAFAERWFADAGAYEEIKSVEAELLDAYVRGLASRKQREQIERSLLSSEAQRRKLLFAAALAARFPRPASRSLPWLALYAAAVMLIMAGLLTWTILQNRELHSELARLPRSTQPVEGGVYSAWLPAGTLRGSASATSLRLANGASLLRLELELEGAEERGAYAGALSMAGRVVWKEEPLVVERRGRVFLATIWVPASLLATGDYTVTLEKSGNAIAYYSLTIVR